MKICFVLPHEPNPRIEKRIDSLLAQHQVTVLVWNKNDSQPFFTRQENNLVKYIDIMEPCDHGKPLKRILPMLRFSKKVCRYLKEEEPDIIYTTNLDLLKSINNYVRRNSKVKIAYEIADLHYMLVDPAKSIKQKLVQIVLRNVERRLSKRVELLITTSPKYYDVYYNQFFHENEVLFIPNIPDVSNFDNYKVKERGPFTVGFVGAVRFEKQLKMLIDVCEKLNINVFIAGLDKKGEINRYSEEKEHVRRFGKYNYSKDIANIYGQCDCIFSVYDSSLNNVKIALPNKLYEAMHCQLPIIAAKDTYLSELISEWNIGESIQCDSSIELETLLKKWMSNDRGFQFLREQCEIRKTELDLDVYNEKLVERINGLK
ncbi:glycosyltransferase family 4 protein [Listeria grandensis]|uniref:Glycosyltransferase family 4 protein n=1 Tax=Listeria grandensis TaxID=1494963 RepID=A0A7X0Y355_9LIST|nr:glycosyltransferase [Listeria grandensis]MBC1935868.1 glycosyltransferase family 4 protein [Listeria grandensis]